MNSRNNSTNSYGFFSVMTERSSIQKQKTKKWKLIAKIITIILTFGLILYIFIDYENFNTILSDELYQRILKNYDNLYMFATIIDYLSNYHVFLIFFIIGFCLWNIYKSFTHILGFFLIELIIFILKLIFRKRAKIFYLPDKNILSPHSINVLCELISEYECPCYRAAFLVYTYMSFITLLFKEKKLRKRKIAKICSRIIFIIICVFLNIGQIFLLQSTIGSIFIGAGIGFIVYFFMFSVLKIDYDRSEQMMSILNLNIIFYILINIVVVGIILCLHFFLHIDETEKEQFQKFCGKTSYNYKEMNLETIFKSLFFFSNLTMILCIKLQRKYIFQSDGDFIGKHFNFEEITESDNLMAHIKNEETLKINTNHILKYLCKVFICLGIALVSYLIYQIIKYNRSESYVFLSILLYLIPSNMLIVFLFFFSKWLFDFLDLEIKNYSD